MYDLVKLRPWEQGIKLEASGGSQGFAFFWFYEWNLFDAVCPGEHTPGSWSWEWSIDPGGRLARMNEEMFDLTVEARPDGAELTLAVENRTDYDWPELAAIIPCYNPGDPEKPEGRNSQFLDGEHNHTYFYGKNGLDLIAEEYPRAIHFNHKVWPDLNRWNRLKPRPEFVFSAKWPTSKRDAYQGLMIRENQDKRWVMGIAWDSFLSAQGHNPWNCMHLSVRLGPLKVRDKNRIRGRIYLFEGSKEECLSRYEYDFLSGQLATKSGE